MNTKLQRLNPLLFLKKLNKNEQNDFLSECTDLFPVQKAENP